MGASNCQVWEWYRKFHNSSFRPSANVYFPQDQALGVDSQSMPCMEMCWPYTAFWQNFLPVVSEMQGVSLFIKHPDCAAWLEKREKGGMPLAYEVPLPWVPEVMAGWVRQQITVSPSAACGLSSGEQDLCSTGRLRWSFPEAP